MTTDIYRSKKGKIKWKKDMRECEHLWFPVEIKKVKIDKIRDYYFCICMKCQLKSFHFADITKEIQLKDAIEEYKEWKKASKKKYGCNTCSKNDK